MHDLNIFRLFVFKFVILSGCFFLLVGTVNVVVDPYSLWDFYTEKGVNQWRLKSEDKERLFKPYQIAKYKPHTVFLGTSHVLNAFDAETYEKLYGHSAYNAALPGMTIYEMRRYVEHALAVDPNLHEIIAGIEFEQFIHDDTHKYVKKQVGFDEEQIACTGINWTMFAKSVLSWQALKDSLITVKVNYDYQLEESFYDRGRHKELAIDFKNHNENIQIQAPIVDLKRQFNYEDACLDENNLNELKSIVDLCTEYHIGLSLLVLPSHARYYEMRAEAWDIYEEWRKVMVSISPIICFDTYNAITQTCFTGMAENDKNEYFWEISHPKKKCGDLILKALAGASVSNMESHRLVTTADVETYLIRLREGRVKWESRHPESVRENKYYYKFSSDEPSEIKAKDFENRHDFQGAEIISGTCMTRADRTLKQEYELNVIGRHELAMATMFGMLEREDGLRYYALAEPYETERSKTDLGSMGFMKPHKHDMSDFRILAPLHGVKTGKYDLYLLEVDSEGIVHQSNSLGKIFVEP